jgi:hypothetical protein
VALRAQTARPGAGLDAKLLKDLLKVLCTVRGLIANYLTWTLHNLLRQVAHARLGEDEPARNVHRAVPHSKTHG